MISCPLDANIERAMGRFTIFASCGSWGLNEQGQNFTLNKEMGKKHANVAHFLPNLVMLEPPQFLVFSVTTTIRLHVV